jgi:SPP1 gp7 family putative phage head morphogenesis protein
MGAAMATVLPEPLPFDEALAAFRAKGFRLLPGYSYKDVWHDGHATGFTVAKAMSVQLLKDIHASLDHALANGVTYADWKKRILPELKKHNWTDWQVMTDPLTGKSRKVELGTERRLRTIFDVNMRTAYAAGHWAKFEANRESRPFIRYVAVMDSRTRPDHRRWHGTVLPMDHPAWATHSPPCGWRCRCSIQQLGHDEMERYGHQVSEDWPAPPAGTPASRTYHNERTGQITEVPYGVDPAFAYPVGQVPYREHMARVFNAGLIDAPPSLAAAAQAESAKAVLPALARDFSRWVDGALAQPHAKGDRYPIGALSSKVLGGLDRLGRTPASGVVTLSDKEIVHILRDAKSAPIAEADLRRFPELIARPDAVLYDHEEPALLYVFKPTGASGERGKLVVRVDFKEKARFGGERATVVTNTIRSAGIVQPGNLAEKRYELLDGVVK